MRINSITQSRNLIKIKKILQGAVNCNTLVIFDIDDVLITPIHNHDFWHPNQEQLLQKIKRQSASEPMNFLDSTSISTTQYRLVDQEIIDIFAYLKKHYVPTIALTAMGTGSFGVIDKLEDLRIKTLQDMGIDLTTLTTFDGQILANELKGVNIVFPTSIGIPMLKDGIIFTAGIDKGTVLEYMLCKKKYYPQTIIFIDDNLLNVESLEKLCIKLQINFYGFHYVAVSLMPRPILLEIDQKAAKPYLKIS